MPGLHRSCSPAARRSTATSRCCPRTTCAAASSSRCRWRRWRCCLFSAAPIAAGVPIVVGGTAVARRPRRLSSSSPQATPLSIFVLNLATLLGLGLGVDYALLLTSRFREELRRAAAGATRPRTQARPGRAINDAVADHRRDRRPGGLLQRPDRPAGPDRADPVRVHGPAVGGHCRRDRRWPGRGQRDHAAAGCPRDSWPANRRVPIRLRQRLGKRVGLPVAPPTQRRGRLGTPRAPRDGPPAARSSFPRCCCCCSSGSPFLHVRFNAPDAIDPAAGRAIASAYDLLASDFGEGEFAPLVPGHPHRRPGHGSGRTWRRSTTTRAALPRIRACQPRRRASSTSTRACRVDAIPAALLRAGRPGRSVRGRAAGRDDQGRPNGVHRLHALRPQPRRGPGAGRRHAQSRLQPRAAAGHDRAGRRRRGRGARRGRAHRRRLPALGAVHPRLDLPRPVVLLRSVVLPAKALIVNALSITASFGALVWIFQDGNLSALLGFARSASSRPRCR